MDKEKLAYMGHFIVGAAFMGGLMMTLTLWGLMPMFLRCVMVGYLAVILAMPWLPVIKMPWARRLLHR